MSSHAPQQAEKNTLDVDISAEEMDRRRQAWKPKPLKVTGGTLWKYAQLAADASHGAITGALSFLKLVSEG